MSADSRAAAGDCLAPLVSDIRDLVNGVTTTSPMRCGHPVAHWIAVPLGADLLLQAAVCDGHQRVIEATVRDVRSIRRRTPRH